MLCHFQDMEEKLEKERRAEEKRQGNDGSNVALEKQRGKEEREWEKEREQFQRELQLMKKKLQGMEEQLTQSTHQVAFCYKKFSVSKIFNDRFKSVIRKIMMSEKRTQMPAKICLNEEPQVAVEAVISKENGV